MTARSDITFDVGVDPRIITVADPSVLLSVQDLHDTIRVFEAQVSNMAEDRMVSAAGKDDLGGGLKVEVTATLLAATVAFAARGSGNVQCLIDGGNLVALDSAGDDLDPISTTTKTQVLRTAASSSVVA